MNNLRLKRALNFEFVQCNLLEHVSPITIIIIALFYLLVLAVVVISFILIESGTYFNIKFEIKCLCYICFSDNLIWHLLFLSKSFSNYCLRQKLKQFMFIRSFTEVWSEKTFCKLLFTINYFCYEIFWLFFGTCIHTSLVISHYKDCLTRHLIIRE